MLSRGGQRDEFSGGSLEQKGVVVRAPFVTQEALRTLITGQAVVLTVPNFFDRSTAKNFIDSVRSKYRFDEYHNDVKDQFGEIQSKPYGVQKIGPAYNEVFSKEGEQRAKALKEYQTEAMKIGPELRKLWKSVTQDPYPADNLLDQMNHKWPGGAEVATFSGEPMFTGIIRFTEPGSTPLAEEPHFDSGPCPKYPLFSALFPILSPTGGGGQLKIWPATDKLKSQRLSDPKQYLKEVVESVQNPISIDPQPGNLYIFCASHPHCVTQFEFGERIGQQVFFYADSSLQKINGEPTILLYN